MMPYLLAFEYPEKSKRKAYGVWVAPASQRQQELWGSAFVIWRSHEPREGHYEAITALCDRFSTSYYSPTPPPANERQEETRQRLELQFEETLQILNAHKSRRESRESNADFRDDDIAVGVIHPFVSLLAHHGAMRAWFVDKHTKESLRDRLEEITAGSPSSSQLFSDVITGELQPSETMIVGSSEELHQLSFDRLIELIDTAETTEEIAQDLAKVARRLSALEKGFPMLIIFALSNQEEEEGELEQERTRRWVIPENLQLTTIRALSGFTKDLWRFSLWVWHAVLQLMRRARIALPFVWPWLRGSAARLVAIVAKTFTALRETAQSALLLTRLGIAVVIGDRPMQEELIEALKELPPLRTLRRSGVVLVQQWNASTLKRRIVASSLVLLFLAAGALGGLAIIRSSRASQEQHFQSAAQNIRETASAIEAKLIYGDDASALELMKEARGKLEELARNDTTHGAQLKRVETELDALSKRLRKETLLPSPAVVVKPASPSRRVLRVGSTWVVVGKTTVLLYSNLSKPPTTIELPKGVEASYAATLNPTTFIVGSGQAAAVIRTGAKLSATPVRLDTNVRHASTYANRLYVLPENQSTVLRLDAIKGGWGRAVTWLKEGTLLSDALSMAVDGSVYILTKTSVLKYHTGLPQLFSFAVEPPLGNPIVITTPKESQPLIVVDANPTRVIVVEKGTKATQGGHVLTQFVQERWKDLRDAVVDEKMATLVVINGQHVEQYKLPALK